MLTIKYKYNIYNEYIYKNIYKFNKNPIDYIFIFHLYTH